MYTLPLSVDKIHRYRYSMQIQDTLCRDCDAANKLAVICPDKENVNEEMDLGNHRDLPYQHTASLGLKCQSGGNGDVSFDESR